MEHKCRMRCLKCISSGCRRSADCVDCLANVKKAENDIKNFDSLDYALNPFNEDTLEIDATRCVSSSCNKAATELESYANNISELKDKQYRIRLKGRGTVKKFKRDNKKTSKSKKNNRRRVRKNQLKIKNKTFKKENNIEYKIIVRYAALTNNIFPNYKMIKFPKTWKYGGDEGALISQPKWQTNNALFYGPKEDMNNAKESINKLYDKYKKNKYISKYIISVN